MISEPRLLAGPALALGAESFADHVARLGATPGGRPELIDVLAQSGLLGRGGAAFPVARKWASVADRADGDARVLVNGAEGEPLSRKDMLLLSTRPQLVIDGALIAASTVGATEIVFYVNAGYAGAHVAIRRALAERRRIPFRVRLALAPPAYVAGEESAAVHFVNDGDARPTVTPPRPFERGISGQPTLVQNVETLAYVALIARFGAGWFRELGRSHTKGSALVTIDGAPRAGVQEIELGTPLGELAEAAGIGRGSTAAVLLGGFFGRWAKVERAWSLPLDPVAMRDAGAAFGSGVISFTPAGTCGVAATSRLMEYMATQSAAQCGPCVFGLRAMADATQAIAAGRAEPAEVDRLSRWATQVAGRGACGHPTGAVGLLTSGLEIFGRDFDAHARRRGCTVDRPLGKAA